MTTFEHAFQAGTLKKRDLVKCCGCGSKVPYSESWVTVAYGVHGNRLPLPVFVHCNTCSMMLDPKDAYVRAFAKDELAGLPDPEKVQREKDLNEQLSKMPEVER